MRRQTFQTQDRLIIPIIRTGSGCRQSAAINNERQKNFPCEAWSVCTQVSPLSAEGSHLSKNQGWIWRVRREGVVIETCLCHREPDSTAFSASLVFWFEIIKKKCEWDYVIFKERNECLDSAVKTLINHTDLQNAQKERDMELLNPRGRCCQQS